MYLDETERAGFEHDDFARLPNYGAHFYCLKDAALLMAMDLQNRASVGEREPPRPEDAVKGFDALEAPWKECLARLVQAVETGLLHAVVMERDWNAKSRPVPARTYVEMQDLCDWLALHGIEPSTFHQVDNADEWAVRDFVDLTVARRDRLRRPHSNELPAPDRPPSESRADLADEVDHLRSQVELLSLELQAKDREARAVATAEKVDPRRKTTYLVTIAALAKLARVDLSRDAAAVQGEIEKMLGDAAPDERTVAKVFLEVPEAIRRRLELQ